jgi:hypothetical protein
MPIGLDLKHGFSPTSPPEGSAIDLVRRARRLQHTGNYAGSRIIIEFDNQKDISWDWSSFLSLSTYVTLGVLMIIIQVPLCFYFVDTYKTGDMSAERPETTIETKQIDLKEIRAKWSKFSEQDVSSFKGNNDLVAQLAAKYGLEKAQA